MGPLAFLPPHDRIVLETNDERVAAFAARLWPRGTPDEDGAAIRLRVEVRDGGLPGRQIGDLPERRLFWEHAPTEFRCGIPGLFSARIVLADATITATAAPELLDGASGPAARWLLEGPVAVLLARRGWRALHAGAASGPKGAVVVRGASGAGKSTLVAAAHEAGLTVLGDESLLVARGDPDALAASVRELTLRADSAALLGILARTSPAFSGGEEKRRVDLFEGSNSAAREARRVTTLLLGPRAPGPARLVPLSPAQFLLEFAKGEIPQEHVGGGASSVARAWAEAGGARLDGSSDLAGAVSLLKALVT
ncbi:MAG TPA: hypothetical protein VF554_03205 [Thermoanaerobaculia bacterium]